VDSYEKIERFYSGFAKIYDGLLKILPGLKKEIKTSLPWLKGEILEIGVGTGYLASLYSQGVGMDISKGMLERARKRLGEDFSLVRANAEELPFKDSSFDTVVSTFTLSSVKNIKKAIKEMRRVLKNRGRLVLVDVWAPEEKGFTTWFFLFMWRVLKDIIRPFSVIEKQGFKILYIKTLSKGKTVSILVGEKWKKE